MKRLIRFLETGLPPNRNGNKTDDMDAIPQKSIMVARKCYEKLGIQQPQYELRDTYAKSNWGPNAEIKRDQRPYSKTDR